MVSVLFSEPKIPQSFWQRNGSGAVIGFSALQRAENSSICDLPAPVLADARFSALQRAENSSIEDTGSAANTIFDVSVLFSEPKIPQPIPVTRAQARLRAFQCSSASRKFLNRAGASADFRARRFQCSSASRKFLNCARHSPPRGNGAFQCSSASRKFLNSRMRHMLTSYGDVSVLFSEPKIPQRDCGTSGGDQCEFQCSSASRKFLNVDRNALSIREAASFSALQRAENSSKFPLRALKRVYERFSALQRAENSSIGAGDARCGRCGAFQCSSASRKFLNRFR